MHSLYSPVLLGGLGGSLVLFMAREVGKSTFFLMHILTYSSSFSSASARIFFLWSLTRCGFTVVWWTFAPTEITEYKDNSVKSELLSSIYHHWRIFYCTMAKNYGLKTAASFMALEHVCLFLSMHNSFVVFSCRQSCSRDDLSGFQRNEPWGTNSEDGNAFSDMWKQV